MFKQYTKREKTATLTDSLQHQNKHWQFIMS